MAGPLAAQDRPAGDGPPSEVPARSQGQSSEAALAVYADAANFQNNGAFALAIEQWKKFLAEHPGDPLAAKAAHYLGVSLMQQESPEYEAAAEAFGRALGSDGFELREEALVNRGWCLYAAGQAAEGAETGQAAQGEARLYHEALSAFGKLLEEFPRSRYRDQAFFYRGESAYALGRLEEAVGHYDRLLELPSAAESPLRCDALYARGVALEELKRTAAALAAYERLLSACPETPLAAEVHVRRGDLLISQEAWDQAAAEFAEAYRSGGELADYALYRQAYCANRAGRSADAAAAYDALLAEFPQSRYASAAQLAAGQSYFQAGDLEAAAEKFRQLLEQEDAATRIEAAHWLSQILLRRGRPNEVVEIARAALEQPGEAAYRSALKMDLADALSLLPEGTEEASQLYQEIYRSAPGDAIAPRALYNAAFAALEAGRHQEAVDLAGQFTERYAQDALAADVRYVAAEARLQAGDHVAAGESYEALLAEVGEHPSKHLWTLRGATAWYMAGEYGKVTRLVGPVLPALESEAERAEGLFLLGASALFLDRPEEAARSLAQSAALGSRWGQADETLLLLGQAQLKSGQREEAARTWKRLIDQFDTPMADQAHYRLAQMHSADEEYPQALEHYEVLLEQAKDPSLRPYALYGKGWCLMQRQEYAAAIEPLTELLRGYEDHSLEAEAVLARGICRRRMGQDDGAAEDLQAYLQTDPSGLGLGHALYELALVDLDRDDYSLAAERLARLVAEVPDYPHLDKVLYELAWALKEAGKAEDAARQFEQLVSRFPETPLAAEASYQVGQGRYAAGAWEAAAEAFRRAASRAAEDELVEKALYKLGWSQFQQQEYAEAQATFADQLQRFPDGSLAADARLMVAESDFKAGRYEAALAAYRAAREAFANADELPAGSSRQAAQIRQLVLLHGGQSASQLKRWDEALAWFDQLREEHPNTAYLAQAFYESGYAHQQRGEHEQALELYAEVAGNYRNEVAARARFMMGELYFSERDLAKAIPEFQRVMYGFGGENAPPEIKPWQAKSGFEAGRCAELLVQSATGERRAKAIELARRFYHYVLEQHGDSELAGKARDRLAVLERL